MMKLEEFANAVLAAVREKADGVFNAWLTGNTKNNGVKKVGITTAGPESKSGSCVYLNDYYREYRNRCLEFGEAAEIVYQQIMRHRNDLKDINTADFLQWNIIKHHIYAKLVNADANGEVLGTVPHRIFLDLAVVYYIKVQEEGEAENERTLSIMIQNDYLNTWGRDEESLYQAALTNMRMDGSTYFVSLEKLLCSILMKGMDNLKFRDEEYVNMYVLTNRNKVFGAVEIMDRNTLQQISEKLADDFIVLPSSVHETVIIPSNKAPEYGELAEMVRGINETLVSMEERLSNHVYRYNRDEGVLKIVK